MFPEKVAGWTEQTAKKHVGFVSQDELTSPINSLEFLAEIIVYVMPGSIHGATQKSRRQGESSQ